MKKWTSLIAAVLASLLLCGCGSIFQAEYYRRIDAEFDKRDFFMGEQCWAFADFGTIQGVYRADGNRKGVFTKERRPKMAAHFLKSRWEKLPNFGYKTR